MYSSIDTKVMLFVNVSGLYLTRDRRRLNIMNVNAAVNGSDALRSTVLGESYTATDTEDVLFDLLSEPGGDWLSVNKFWSTLSQTGLRRNDPRFVETVNNIKEVMDYSDYSGQGDFKLDRETFRKCITDNIFLIGKAFKSELIIPEFEMFTKHISAIYDTCKTNTAGMPANYIPQLERVNRDFWGVSVCTTDGQRFSVGDTEEAFCLQSCSKPLNYALALSESGQETVHRFVNHEPSGGSSNELVLDSSNKPHNPMINSGAILVTSLLRPELQTADRFDHVFQLYQHCAGHEYVGFSNCTYLSERESADRNFALGYYMRENKCFPDGTDLKQTLEFYFQLCSVEVTVESASVMAATLANGGICPVTGERVFEGDAVRNTLSLMYSCGMYDYSGQFAFTVGLPAKSSVSGAVMLVVPNVMGMCCWAPPLDGLGNSCKGLQFCEELVKRFNFHNYDNLRETTAKLDPRVSRVDQASNSVVGLLFGAAHGDVTAVQRFYLMGMDLGKSDYDGRTALHLAAAEGHLNVVRLLVDTCKVPPNPKDRWGHTPLDDASRFKHTKIVDLLLERMTVRKEQFTV